MTQLKHNAKNRPAWLWILLVFWTISVQSQEKTAAPLTISPMVRMTDANARIIETLKLFLSVKDEQPLNNPYWLAEESQRYGCPFQDILGMEKGKNGPQSYRPTLMGIIDTEDTQQKTVKLAWIGHDSKTGENQLKCIFNMVAFFSDGQIRFGLYTNLATQNWQRLESGPITYLISPGRKANAGEIEKQRAGLEFLSKFFEADPFPITYYSCVNPEEVFKIKGFDYHPMMYADTTGGFAESGERVFSGNNSEYYQHEMAHIFIARLFPDIDSFLNEGLASFLGGSGVFDYEWHRNKMQKMLKTERDFRFSDHLDPYERLFFEKETPIPYLTAALVCERTLRLHGKQQLFSLFRLQLDFWENLKTVGLSKTNFDRELSKELNRSYLR